MTSRTRGLGVIPIILCATLFASGCSTQTGPLLNSSRTIPTDSRASPEQSRSESLAIAEKLRALNDSAIPDLRRPTATECGPRSDEGVKFSWSVEGAPPSDPRVYIEQAEAVLEENGYSTHRTESSLHDHRPLYFIGADGAGKSTIGLGASSMNTVLQLSSTCAEGEADAFY